MRQTENKNKSKTPNHITSLCWHLHWSLAALRKAELLTGSGHKSHHLLSLQSHIRTLSILLGPRWRTTKLAASSSVCCKDYLSASSSCKSHSHPHLICSLSASRTSKEIHKNTAIHVKRCKRNLSPFHNKVFSTYKGFTSGSRKARQKIAVEARNTHIFDKSGQQEIKVLH